MKNPVLSSVLFLALATATIQADQPGDASDIQGTWIPIKAELAGQTMKQDFLNTFTLSMHGGKYEVAAESLDKGTYTINSAAKPRTVDITGVEGPNAGKKILAIYELRGDTLRVCYGLGGTPRPAEFKSPAGTQTFLVTYKRKKA